jgi:hypothetical protein
MGNFQKQIEKVKKDFAYINMLEVFFTCTNKVYQASTSGLFFSDQLPYTPFSDQDLV